MWCRKFSDIFELPMQGRGDEDNHTVSWFTQYFILMFREGARE